jgi:hypothetical protein
MNTVGAPVIALRVHGFRARPSAAPERPANAARDGTLTAAEGEAWAAEVAALHARSRLFGTIGYFYFWVGCEAARAR